MDPAFCNFVSPDIRREVVAEYIKLETTLGDGVNPIEKLEVVCSESQGIVNLDVIECSNQEGFNLIRGMGGTTNSNAAATQWRHVIYAKLNTTQATVSDVQNHQVSKLAELNGRIRHVERMICTMSVAPARVIG